MNKIICKYLIVSKTKIKKRVLNFHENTRNYCILYFRKKEVSVKFHDVSKKNKTKILTINK